MRQVVYRMVVALLFAGTAVSAVAAETDYQLQQVVIVSRHGLRAPLTSPESTLGQMTPYQWPQSTVASSYLTERGGILENYFGHYLQQWLSQAELLSADRCPTDKEVQIYANSKQRTRATAQYLSAGAFPGCLINVKQRAPFGTMDPTFNPIIHNASADFKQQAFTAMEAQASKDGITGLNHRLASAYKLIADIIDYPQSADCKEQQQCDFLAQPTQLRIENGQEPGISGPLRNGTSIADAFLLQYYEGQPLNQIAWGRINSEQQLAQIVRVKEEYNSLLFATPMIAKMVSHNLLTYIGQQFNHPSHPKLTVLVGHDSNVASILSALQVNPYQLPQQMETTPIGGKVVFERWRDHSNQDWIKIEYLYQSTQQIRDLTPLSLQQPPMRVTLTLRNCPVNSEQMCKLEDFYQVLHAAGVTL